MKHLPLLLCVFSACSSPAGAPRGGNEQPPQAFIPTSVPSGTPLTPIPANLPAPDPLLMAGDLLQIAVFRQPEMDQEIRIPQDGQITVPLIGAVQAAAKTSGLVEQEIRRRLEKDYLHEAHVTVTVKE